MPNRLFVPLNTMAFNWYLNDGKCWEIGKARKSFNVRHARQHNKVELRRGYSTKDSLYGDIIEVIETSRGVSELFYQIAQYEYEQQGIKAGLFSYQLIIPGTRSSLDAINFAKTFIGDAQEVFAFKVNNLRRPAHDH